MKKKRIHFCVVFLLLVFSPQGVAQSKDVSPVLLKDACDCLYKVDINLDKGVKNDSIKKCVTNAIISYQTSALVGELLKSIDTISADMDTARLNARKKFVVTVNKDYDKIQSQLMQDCPALKELLATNNTEHKNSYSKDKKALEFYRKGQEFVANNAYESGIVEFNKAVKKDPTFAFAWDNLGICYRKTGRFEEAIKCYDKSLELDPKGSTPLINKAAAYDFLGDHQRSIIAYQKYIEVYPDEAEGYYGIARQQNFTKDYANALENALKAVAIYDESGSAYKEDAINVIREIVVNLKNENKLDVFNTFAEKHGLQKIEK